MSDTARPYEASEPGRREAPIFQDTPAPDLRKLLAVFMRRLGVFGVVALVAFAAFMGVMAQQPRLYAGVARLVIGPKQTDALKDQNAQGSPDRDAVDTEVQLLSSTELARLAADRLNLYADPEFNPPHAGSPAPIEATREAVAQAVLNHIQIKRVGLTAIVTVTARSLAPEKAAKLANAYAQAYLDSQVDDRNGALQSSNQWLTDQLDKLGATVREDEAAVQRYKIDHGLLAAGGGTLAEQEVSDLNHLIADAQADLASKSAALRATQDQAGRTDASDTLVAISSETIRGLRLQEADMTRQLADLQTRYGPLHPEVQKAQNRLADVRSQLRAELNRIQLSQQGEVSAARERLNSLVGARSGARGALETTGRAAVGLADLQRKADASRAVYEAFLNRAKEVSAQATAGRSGSRISSPAQVSYRPVQPNLKLAFVIGLAIAAGCGWCAILLAEIFDTSVRVGTDIEDKLLVPYAGAIPVPETVGRFGSDRNAPPPQDYLIANPFTSFAEAFRNVRAFLMLAARDERAPRLIAVASSVPKEGKSVTALCLMRVMAQAGSRVVLVDCDLRRRGVSGLIEEVPTGLLEVLQGKASLEQAVIQDEESGGYILPVKKTAFTPKDLFSGPAFDRLLAELAANFDYVVLDTPPVLSMADARILCAKVDRVLFLIRWAKTPLRAAQAALDVLQESGARLAGAALTRMDLRRQAREGYGDAAYYYKDYQKGYYRKGGAEEAA